MTPRPRSEPQSISMAPVAIIVVVIAAVAGFLAMNSSADEGDGGSDPSGADGAAAPADAGGVDPFADLDPVAPPEPRVTNTAPAGLLENADYKRAQALGEEGVQLVTEALALQEKGDDEGFKTKAVEGRDKLFEALGLTTDWLMDLQDRYPKDRQVKQVETARKAWQRALGKVRHVD